APRCAIPPRRACDAPRRASLGPDWSPVPRAMNDAPFEHSARPAAIGRRRATVARDHRPPDLTLGKPRTTSGPTLAKAWMHASHRSPYHAPGAARATPPPPGELYPAGPAAAHRRAGDRRARPGAGRAARRVRRPQPDGNRGDRRAAPRPRRLGRADGRPDAR